MKLENSPCQLKILQPACRELARQQIVNLRTQRGNSPNAELLYSLFPSLGQAGDVGRNDINIKTVLSSKGRITTQFALEQRRSLWMIPGIKITFLRKENFSRRTFAVSVEGL